MSQNTSPRIGFKFWLNLDKSDEEAIADTIEILKRERSFTQTIRDGIRLIRDLRQGKLDILFELFPWVRAEFMEYMRDLQFAPAEQTQVVVHTSQSLEPEAIKTQQAWLDAEQERLESERKWHEKRMRDAEKALETERKKIETERTQTQNLMQEQLDRLEQILLQQGNQPISSSLQELGSGGGSPTQNNSGLKALSVPQISPPIYDDDDEDLLTVTKAKSDGNASANFLAAMQALQQ